MDWKTRFAVAALGMLVSACVSTPPVPELVAEMSSGSGAPRIITGEILRQCTSQTTFISGITIAETGEYNPGASYAFAERMHMGNTEQKSYAARIRAYEVKYGGTGYFGRKIDHHFACYFDYHNGQLRYLTNLTPDHEGRIDRHRFDGEVRNAFGKMAGKTKMQLWFGG